MLEDFIIPVTVILVFCYFMIPAFQYGVDNRIHQTKIFLMENPVNCDIYQKEILNPPSYNLKNIPQSTYCLNNTRADVCLRKKKDNCPITSYKQCTNNVKSHERCDCQDGRSFETCDQHKDLVKSKPKQKLIPIKHPKGRDRVNMYAPQNTVFNKLSIVKNRTHPYVADL